jgi:predicted tellurium resistance membrane protein TerC
LGDVSISTKSYAVPRSPSERLRRTKKKEVVLMRHENGTPAEDHRRRLRAASYTMLVVVLVVVLAAIMVGPGRVIDLVGAYLTPVVVVLGVIVGVFGLAAWEIAKLHDRHKQPWGR